MKADGRREPTPQRAQTQLAPHGARCPVHGVQRAVAGARIGAERREAFSQKRTDGKARAIPIPGGVSQLERKGAGGTEHAREGGREGSGRAETGEEDGGLTHRSQAGGKERWTGDRSKVRYCKKQCCIGTWNVRSMNQGKLEVVKNRRWQE